MGIRMLRFAAFCSDPNLEVAAFSILWLHHGQFTPDKDLSFSNPSMGPRFAEPRFAEPRFAGPRIAEPRFADPRFADPAPCSV